jgi:predicted alpha/beta-fold hydrolase
MFDINAIINQVLAAAIAQATEPLIKRIEELEAKQAQVTPAPFDINAAIDTLGQQDWFWEKIRNFINAGVEVVIEEHTGKYDHDDFVMRGEDLSELIKETIGDYDDFVTKDELPEFPDTEDLLTVDNIKDYIDEALSDVRLVRC